MLSGCWAPLGSKETDRADAPHEALLRWVIERPWPLLLAQLVFAQETWAAERLNGGLALEVTDPSSRLEPPRVDVVVTLPDGREAHCGSLAALLPRALGMLGLAILAPARDHATLDARLAPLIGELVRRKVWSFEGRGGGRRRPGYAIADDFGSACLRIFGSNHFYRAGDPIARALRQAAESLARERLDGATVDAILQPAIRS